MRLGRVIGTITIPRRVTALNPGQYVIVDVFDSDALAGIKQAAPRKSPMPESLVVFRSAIGDSRHANVLHALLDVGIFGHHNVSAE